MPALGGNRRRDPPAVTARLQNDGQRFPLRRPSTSLEHVKSSGSNEVTTVTERRSSSSSESSADEQVQRAQMLTHRPHDNGPWAIELALREDPDPADCRDFLSGVPGFPCNAPRGHPKILDLERYELINKRDKARMIPLLIEAVSTVIFLYDQEGAHLNNLLWVYGPAFTYTLVTSTHRLRIQRDKGSDIVQVRFGERGAKTWEAAALNEIVSDKSWRPIRGESLQLGRHSQPAMVEAIGVGIARGIVTAVLAAEGDLASSQKVAFDVNDRPDEEYFARPSKKEAKKQAKYEKHMQRIKDGKLGGLMRELGISVESGRRDSP